MNTPIATDFAAIAASMKEHANNSDAVLIQRCHQFAEAEITSWYRYVIAPAHLADEQDTPSDMAATIGLSQRPRRPRGAACQGAGFVRLGPDAIFR